MKLPATLVALSAFAALAGCEGRADENLAAAAGNEVEALGDDLGNIAADAVNTAGEVGAAVGNGVDSAAEELGDGETGDGNEAAAGNGQQ